MLNMLEKKKSQSLYGAEESYGMADKVFEALKSGDKEGFKSALKLCVKEMVMELEMSEDDAEGMEDSDY